MRRTVAMVALALALVGVSTSPARADGCQFQFGFKVLHDLIPDRVGSCLESENHNPANGDGLQHTSGGLLVWRKADNWTAFTDGYYTWINGPNGLQKRLNSERFPWESAPLASAPSSGLLYQADWSGGPNGWVVSSDWKVLNGMLISDGSSNDDNAWASAPYRPPTANYAVEADAQIIRGDGRFYLRARQPENGSSQNYSGGVWYGRALYLGYGFDSNLASRAFDPKGDWHTYRLEVRDNTVRLLVDGGEALAASDNRDLLVGRVGFWSKSTQVNVRSFKVISL